MARRSSSSGALQPEASMVGGEPFGGHPSDIEVGSPFWKAPRYRSQRLLDRAWSLALIRWRDVVHSSANRDDSLVAVPSLQSQHQSCLRNRNLRYREDIF